VLRSSLCRSRFAELQRKTSWTFDRAKPCARGVEHHAARQEAASPPLPPAQCADQRRRPAQDLRHDLFDRKIRTVDWRRLRSPTRRERLLSRSSRALTLQKDRDVTRKPFRSTAMARGACLALAVRNLEVGRGTPRAHVAPSPPARCAEALLQIEQRARRAGALRCARPWPTLTAMST